MTDEQQRLCDLIDGHCAAMKAQVKNRDVMVEVLFNSDWIRSERILSFAIGPADVRWHRLAPAPKIVPLDQGDFLGEGRVTHLRKTPFDIRLVCNVDLDGVAWLGGFLRYIEMAGWECSRDNGAPGSWWPCSKEAKA